MIDEKDKRTPDMSGEDAPIATDGEVADNEELMHDADAHAFDDQPAEDTLEPIDTLGDVVVPFDSDEVFDETDEVVEAVDTLGEVTLDSDEVVEENPYADEQLTMLSPVHTAITPTGPKKINLLKVSDKRLSSILLNEVMAGKNEALHNMSVSTMQIDDKWIDQVENALQSMEAIMRDPKSFIKEEREVVAVEKVRKVDHQTIRHLSSHTENVRKVFDDGRVQPTKLLTKFLETDYAIYENRVIYTLLQRLKPFIDVRYRAIKDILEQEVNDVHMKSRFKFSDIEFDVGMSLRAVTASADKSHMEHNLRLIEKLDNIKKRVQSLETTKFCQNLKGIKLVTPPLQKTNVFKSNNDYRNCFNLWLFISGFTEVGYSVEVTEKNIPIETTYYQDLSRIIVQSVATVLKTNAIRADAYRKMMYQKKDVKQYKAKRGVALEHTAPVNLFEDDTKLNQFYFERIRSLVKGLPKDDSKGGAKQNINAGFTKLFKGLNRINNEVFLDAIKANEPEPKKLDPVADVTPLGRQITRKRNDILGGRKLLQKLLLLQQLKEDDLNAMRRRVKAQIKKLDVSEQELERKIALKIANEKKKEDERKRKQKEIERQRKIKEKQKLLEQKKQDAAKRRKTAESKPKKKTVAKKKTTDS